MSFSIWMLAEAGLAAGLVFASRVLIHFFQLESYQLPGYFRTLKRRWRTCIRPGTVMLLPAAVTALLAAVTGGTGAVLLSLICALVMPPLGWLTGRRFDEKKAKKPLAFTARVKRLCVISGILDFLLMLPAEAARQAVPAAGFVLLLYPLLLPLLTAAGGLLAWPAEKGISELYFRDAQRMLKERPDLIKIGITGSYGKTSVKFILGTLLQERFQTLVTPSSFNTPMGLTKVIRAKLRPSHQIFLAEMGARHVGDIKELCRLVHPTMGVLTSVGPQHLDTFKTIDRIKNTKYELMDAVPEDGCCFFPDDHAICRELYDRTAKPRRLCSLQASGEADVWAEDITVSSRGSSFRLCTKTDSVPCETKLLGEHNIQNILLSAMVCLELGMTMKQIARGIGRLQPVEHRLQLIDNPGGMTIIDDAFNSNPTSSGKALEVLARFKGRRIIITPGMVELGTKEAEYNRAFGEKMAACTDIAILVGKKHVQPIADGLKKAGFPDEMVYRAESLDAAAALLRQLGRPGDTVLFENDLPDNYTE